MNCNGSEKESRTEIIPFDFWMFAETEELNGLLDKCITRMTLKARRFVDSGPILDVLTGIVSAEINGQEFPDDLFFSGSISLDYDYFAFTKATKTLLAINRLLKQKENRKNYFSKRMFLH